MNNSVDNFGGICVFAYGPKGFMGVRIISSYGLFLYR